MAPGTGPLNPAYFGDTSAPGMAPGMVPAAPAGYVPAAPAGYAPAAPAGYDPARSVLDVIGASLFDDIYSPEAQARWTPLRLGTFFTEGWNTPFVLPTAGGGGLAGTGGAPRQGWIGAYGGQFFRAWFFAFVYAQGVNSHIGNTYVGQYTIFVPFNRRFEMYVNYNFIVSNKASGTYKGNTGDTNFVANFMLSESKNFGQLLHVGFLTPTGAQSNGNGVANVNPEYQTWWNFYDKWVLKTETGVTVPINHAKTSGYAQFNNVVALGRYFPGSKESWFQQWWVYMAATDNATIAGTPRHENFFSLQPGMRCKVPAIKLGTGLWYFFAAVNVPMGYPHAVSYEPIFAVLYDY